MSPDKQEHTDNTLKIETHYAVAKLQEAVRVIKQAINEFPMLRKRLEKKMKDKPKARQIYEDLQNQHQRLLGALDTAALSFLEADQEELANHSLKLRQSIKSFNLMTPDYSKLCEVFNNYISGLPLVEIDEENADDKEARTTNNRIIGHLMNNVRMGYYPTCTDNLAHIVRGMDFPEGVVFNLLDPCCGCGLALRFLAEMVSDNGNDCRSYGIELDGYRAEEALTRIDRVGFGSYFHSRISNEAFHAMLLNPPYLSVMRDGGNNTRSEKLFLVDSINNLMMGGLLIYIIPYYRLTADVARILSENFNDVSVWKFTNSEFKKFKQVAIMGTRVKRRDDYKTASTLTSLALCPDLLSDLTELQAGRYQLPAIAKDVALFKGAVFNESELAEQLRHSKSMSRLFQQSDLDSTSKRPLLPLSLGQIGLVGGSGLINGLVDCETPHIIKGCIIKEKHARMEDNLNSRDDVMSTTLTETISNKLIFNLLTPQGFISLTEYSGIGTFIEQDNAPSDDDSHLGQSISDSEDLINIPEADNSFVDDENILFPLGRTVITCGAKAVLSDCEINKALFRHQTGDFGTVSEDDWKANEKAVKNGDRILSSYLSPDDVTFWIITEWDRSATTVLLPGEY